MRNIAICITAALLISVRPAAARDTIQDCRTYGPHSHSCAEALRNQNNPDVVYDRLNREHQEQRDRQERQRR